MLFPTTARVGDSRSCAIGAPGGSEGWSVRGRAAGPARSETMVVRISIGFLGNQTSTRPAIGRAPALFRRRGSAQRPVHVALELLMDRISTRPRELVLSQQDHGQIS